MKKPRCYKSSNKEIKKAVRFCNLSTEKVGESSGVIESLNRGERIVGGYIIKTKNIKNKPAQVVGWGAALSDNEFCLYVLPEFRKMGLASRIVKRVKKEYPRHLFCPWNPKTLSFFEKRNANFTSYYL